MSGSASLPAEVYGASFESPLLMRAVAGLLASQMIGPFNDSCCVGADIQPFRSFTRGILHRDLHGKAQSKHVSTLLILWDEPSRPICAR